jgi:N-acetylmuramoyl-L-alanine amidase
MQKRGLGRRANVDPTHHIYLTLFELILVALVLLALLSYVKSIEKNTILQKSYLSKDLALLTSTIYASPGNVNYVYVHPKIDLTQFKLVFDSSQVTVAESSTTSVSTPIYYPYALDQNLKFQRAELDKPYAVLFLLAGGELRISSSSIEKGLECPDIYTKDQESRSKRIVIDPGHGEDTSESSLSSGMGRGEEEGTLKERDLTRDIAESLNRQLVELGGFGNVQLTRHGDGYVSGESRLEIANAENESLVISIHTGNDYTEDYDSITAYVYSASANLLKGEKLACLILKEYAQRFPEVKRTEVVHLESAELWEDEKILETGNVAVLVQVGNLRLPNTILTKPAPEIASPIYNAVVKYYE